MASQIHDQNTAIRLTRRLRNLPTSLFERHDGCLADAHHDLWKRCYRDFLYYLSFVCGNYDDDDDDDVDDRLRRLRGHYDDEAAAARRSRRHLLLCCQDFYSGLRLLHESQSYDYDIANHYLMLCSKNYLSHYDDSDDRLADIVAKIYSLLNSAVKLSNRKSRTGRFDILASSLSYPGAISLHEINDAASSNSRSYYVHASVVHNHNITQWSPNVTIVNEQPISNRPRLPETFLGITTQTALAALAIWTSSTTNFSQNGKILLCSAVAFNVIGFLCCLFSILLFGRKTGVAPRIVTGAGFVFTAYGFLAIVGSMLSESKMLWVTGLVCILCFPALASTFLNKSSVQPQEALSGAEFV